MSALRTGVRSYGNLLDQLAQPAPVGSLRCATPGHPTPICPFIVVSDYVAFGGGLERFVAAVDSQLVIDGTQVIAHSAR